MPDVLLYDDPAFERHETGPHPESAERLRSIRNELKRLGLSSRVGAGATRLATRDELARVHTPAHIDRIAATAGGPARRLDSDTLASPGSYEAALLAAGSACDAVDRVLAGEARRALCLVRPPGHHALPDHAMGFCLFSNIAIAAAHARAAHGLERILIVDWDVHHGNGTQDVFYADGHVSFLSVHRYPFYPGTGGDGETGTGAGLGATFNVPLRFGVARREYIAAFSRALEDAASRARPELILVSAGFDAHAEDPIGSLGLDTEDFGELTRLVCDAAGQHCGGKVISLLEGGYNVKRLAESVAVHLHGLLSYGDERPDD